MTVLVFELFGRDNSAKKTFDHLAGSVDHAGKRVRGLGNDADSAGGPLSKLTNIISSLRSKVLEASGALIKGVSSIGAVASTAASGASLLAPYAAQAAHWLGMVGRNALGAAPALLGMAVAGGVLVTALKRIGPSIGEALTPISDKFQEITVRAGNLASKGLTTLAEGFTKANFPAVSSGMDSIAVSANHVTARLLEWGKSTAGVTAIRNVMEATSRAAAMLGPHVSRLVEAFGNMIGRIVGISTAAGAGGLATVLDKVAAAMDRINEATVRAGMEGLRQRYLEVKSGVQQLNDVIHAGKQFWTEYRVEIGIVQDVLSVLAIAFGGPVIASAAATGLIIRHWDQLKAAKAGFDEAMSSRGVDFMNNMRLAVAEVVPALVNAWHTIWEAIGPVLSEIWDKIKNKLIPALGEFIAAVAPVVSFLIDVLGPVVATVFESVVRIISGAIDIITGIFQIFTAFLTGDWGKMWEGIKNILSGAWQIITALFRSYLFDRIGGMVARFPGFIVGFFIDAGVQVVRSVTEWIGRLIDRIGTIRGHIVNTLGNLGSLLYQAGRNVIQGLIDGIWSMAASVGNAIGSIAQKIRNALPFSPAKEGPLSGSGAPDLAGAKIATMIAGGMIQGVPQVLGAAYQLAGAAALSGGPSQGSLFSGGSVFAGQRGTQVPPIVIQGDGSRFTELILEMLRKAINDRGGNAQRVLGR